MSVWMEIRCEFRAYANVVFWENHEQHRCWSSDNAGPMEDSCDSLKGVSETFKELERQAKAAGWRKIRKPLAAPDGCDITGWICPHCAKYEVVNCEAKP